MIILANRFIFKDCGVHVTVPLLYGWKIYNLSNMHSVHSEIYEMKVHIYNMVTILQLSIIYIDSNNRNSNLIIVNILKYQYNVFSWSKP